MSQSRPSPHGGPVVPDGDIRRDRRPTRRPSPSPLTEPPKGPLPGTLLVLLSRLHRAEDNRPAAGGD